MLFFYYLLLLFFGREFRGEFSGDVPVFTYPPNGGEIALQRLPTHGTRKHIAQLTVFPRASRKVNQAAM